MQKKDFLNNYQRFQLGVLPTEQPHPLTQGLSQIIAEDLGQAIDVLKNVDRQALEHLKDYAQEIENLKQVAQQVLKEGGRIFLCGCGATGRLSMLTEFLFREKYQTDQVRAFMAGGDVALVHSLEGFEDYPELGARHLNQLGFAENDLLISSTEGGETPFVIGATEEAAKISRYKPFFLYCNPDDILKDKVERSRRVIENEQIEKICLYVGSMALSGSTRMQASTVLQLALGAALVEVDRSVLEIFDEFIQEFEAADFIGLKELIEKEHWIYGEGEYLMYMPRDFAITVFTDTTERSPTFNLPSFENNQYKGDAPSLCYILIPSATTPEVAWEQLLLRKPSALDWPEIDTQTSSDYLASFDFSKHSLESREERIGDIRQYLFEIKMRDQNLEMSLAGVEREWVLKSTRSLIHHTLVKLMLNIHSTLLMGKMQRYQSNIMTWVTPTNAKLIDRATRYVVTLLEQQNIHVDYLDVVDHIYQEQEKMDSKNCIVLKVYQNLLNKN